MNDWTTRRYSSQRKRFDNESKMLYGNKPLHEFSDEELDDFNTRINKYRDKEDIKTSLALFGLCGLLGYGVVKSINWIVGLTATKSYQRCELDLASEEINRIQRARQNLKREIK